MSGLDLNQIIPLWEACTDLHPQARALRLLHAGDQAEPLSLLAQLPVGERDRRLLGLYRSWFGDALTAVDTCPRCGVRVELELSPSALLTEAPSPAPCQLTLDDCTVRFRPFNTDDLLAARETSSPEDAERLLLSRVVLEVRRGGVQTGADTLDPDELAALSSSLDAADPLAEILLQAGCPDCGSAWSALLEIGEHLWSRVVHDARQALWEVHALAAAYGWTEAEIFALNPIRRRWYVARVSA